MSSDSDQRCSSGRLHRARRRAQRSPEVSLPIVATVLNTTNKGVVDEFTQLEVAAENEEAALAKDLATHPNGYLMTVSGTEQISYAKRAQKVADR